MQSKQAAFPERQRKVGKDSRSWESVVMLHKPNSRSIVERDRRIHGLSNRQYLCLGKSRRGYRPGSRSASLSGSLLGIKLAPYIDPRRHTKRKEMALLLSYI